MIISSWLFLFLLKPFAAPRGGVSNISFDPYNVSGKEWYNENTNKLIRNKDPWNFLWNSITATLFHSFFRKNIFYSKNIQYAYNFYGTDLKVCRGVFRTQPNIYGGASLRKSQKSFIVDARLGSKYVSGIGFTVEKVYRSHYLSDIVKVNFKSLSLPCFSN